ncbi:Uncharacterized protein PEX1_049590 [Penicillium expansum]|uniref:BTB domain-containing protein n=1 Tax=Penicillium expansum TaxID=27334 RepID=A0A0A2JRI0_PENEN|nr:Uncharacterized protein PEX2_012110 [Penicillium expansum]KGO38935.1 Uncharacterized protein PEXP_058130 [Penicillium expansum]KGO58014.1 Uncharacterized protein PEX1_049590 [Penicillium expansum]KGO62175.1 Uncharacterized protein PEX2_012110 [Penicillium expansum]
MLRNTQLKELLHGLASIRFDSKYSDLTIVCGDEEHAVHKCIVCPRSGFFAEACDGGFEGLTINRVVLDDEPTLVKQMVEYLYTLDYHVEVLSQQTDPSPQSNGEAGEDNPEQLDGIDEEAATACNTLSVHISMYSLADRMCIHGLKALSKEKLEKELTRRQLDSSTFPHATHEIYKSTTASDQGLRDLIVKITMDNLVCLRTGSKTTDPTEAETGVESGPVAFTDSLVKSVPQFSSDLAVAMMDRTVADWNRHGMCKPNWVRQDN